MRVSACQQGGEPALTTLSMNFYNQWSDPNLSPAMKELNKKLLCWKTEPDL